MPWGVLSGWPSRPHPPKGGQGGVAGPSWWSMPLLVPMAGRTPAIFAFRSCFQASVPEDAVALLPRSPEEDGRPPVPNPRWFSNSPICSQPAGATFDHAANALGASVESEPAGGGSCAGPTKYSQPRRIPE